MLWRVVLIALVAAVPAVAQQSHKTKEQCEAWHGELPATLSGTANAITGDTLTVVAVDKHTPDIRLWAIRAPELRNEQTGRETAVGARSRGALSALLLAGRNVVSCRQVEYDLQCRIVADCETPRISGTLTIEMLRSEWAKVYSANALVGGSLPALEDAQAQARRERRGLWRGWIPPDDQ